MKAISRPLLVGVDQTLTPKKDEKYDFFFFHHFIMIKNIIKDMILKIPEKQTIL